MSDETTERRAWRSVGPFGIFQTGPHRTVREVWDEYRDIVRVALRGRAR